MASLKKRISAVFPELCLREDLPYRELTTLGVGTVLPLMAEPADDRQLQRLLKLLNSGKYTPDQTEIEKITDMVESRLDEQQDIIDKLSENIKPR